MKIAIPAQGKDRSAKVDPHFARARCFLVVDIDHDALGRNKGDRRIYWKVWEI
ncbi:MAG: NifB/NifX family molybdenum-iron cluster-binding protein [Phycisphaerae bacterium]